MACKNPPYYVSAYSLAVKNGFKGTEEEWYQSMNQSLFLAQQAAEEAKKHSEEARLATAGKQNTLDWVTDADINAMFDGTYEGEMQEDPEGQQEMEVEI